MIHYVFAVKDELQGEFFTPIYLENQTLATRDFKFKINNIDQWKYNASDYSLYCLGSFDSQSGEFVSHIEKICGGRSVVDA